MINQHIAVIFQALCGDRSQEGWAEFLKLYSSLIFQVAKLSTRDPDDAADCFLFACEQLNRNNFRRLLRFRPDGPASFGTWLRAVVRNLCLDWNRKRFGRRRTFQSILRLPLLQREVYRSRYQEGLSIDATFFSLRTQFPNVTREEVTDAEEQVSRTLTSRQRWLLSAAKDFKKPTVLTGSFEDSSELLVADTSPSPETLASRNEERRRLASALLQLSSHERFLMRLRYQHGLTLEKVARLAGLRDAQTADRHIKEIIQHLRNEVVLRHGKAASMSV